MLCVVKNASGKILNPKHEIRNKFEKSIPKAGLPRVAQPNLHANVSLVVIASD